MSLRSIAMEFQSVEYKISAYSLDQFPRDELPEVALSGRSNVGKSSLLNFLVGRKNVAKVSRTPGKTRAINFFEIDNRWRLVDLPGYGFARLSRQEVERWGRLIDRFLRERPNLAGVIQLIDSRHDPTRLDLEMMEWLAQAGIPTLIALTKTDKIGKNQQRSRVASFKRQWIHGADWPIVATSSEKREGRRELVQAVGELLENFQSRAADEAPSHRRRVSQRSDQ